MVHAITYTTISNVLDSWEGLKRTKDYERIVGLKLFQRFFRACPEAKILFGFPMDMDVDAPDVLRSKRFLAHAAHLLDMFDTALNLLGPDIELLTEMMEELGVKHSRYGVKPRYFPLMRDALIETLKETLGPDFTLPIEKSWEETFDALSGDMIRTQKALTGTSYQ